MLCDKGRMSRARDKRIRVKKMDGLSFQRWILEARASGLVTTDVDLAKLLDVTPATVTNFKRRGCDRRTALACAALLAGIRVQTVEPAATQAVDEVRVVEEVLREGE